MTRTGLMAVLLALGSLGGAMAQEAPPRIPAFAPLVERACLPLMRGGTVAQAAENARPLAFTILAKNATQISVQRDEDFVVTFGPKSCFATLAHADSSVFAAAERELRAFLPRFGRYWAGRIEPDRMGLRYRKYRAGGFTFVLEEQVDEHSRRLNLTVGP